MSRRVSSIALLIEKGADVNARDNGGKTPLLELLTSWLENGKMERIPQDDIGAATVLLEKGADPNIADNGGLRPLTAFLPGGWPEMADLLKKHGAK